MIATYSTDVEKARDLAISAHYGMVDKAGAPYIMHPERVADRLDKLEEKVVGWLHDVVEDTDVTLDAIRKGFGYETSMAVDAITHRKGESWSNYLTRVKANAVATAVKISDLTDNLNLSRLPKITPKDVERAEKYTRALRFLMELDGE